jgi:hypothetical protein
MNARPRYAREAKWGEGDRQQTFVVHGENSCLFFSIFLGGGNKDFMKNSKKKKKLN